MGKMKLTLRQRGMIEFNFDVSDNDFVHSAITRSCGVHRLPRKAMATKLQFVDPWLRVLKIGEMCRKHNVSLALNSSTIIGQTIKDGDKSEFWQKVMPILFEDVCFRVWTEMRRGTVFGTDAYYGKLRVDFKCKHRDATPMGGRNRYIATVPVFQRNQETDFYCMGQISKGMRNGYIIGVISKAEFQDKCRTKEKGEEDDNGEGYVDPIDYVYLHELYGWQKETLDGFIPLRYILSGYCK